MTLINTFQHFIYLFIYLFAKQSDLILEIHMKQKERRCGHYKVLKLFENESTDEIMMKLYKLKTYFE